MASLRQKLLPTLPDLVQNTRGQGYRLSLTPQPVAEEADEPAVPLPREELSLPRFLERLSLTDHGGLVERGSQFVIETASPIELLSDMRRVVTNIIDGQVSYDFHTPATALKKVGELISVLSQQVLQRAPDFSRTNQVSSITDHHALSLLAAQLRIVITLSSCVDSICIVNADNEYRAVAYYYLAQDRRAIKIKERTTAQHHALQLLSHKHAEHDGIIHYAEGVDRTRILSDLHNIIAARSNDPDLCTAFHALTSPRRPPASEHQQHLFQNLLEYHA